MKSETAIVAYAETTAADVLRAAPILDRSATRDLAERLFPGRRIEQFGDELLQHAGNPAEDVAYIGCFPGLDLVCSWQLVADRPSRAAARVLAGPGRPVVVLHAMHHATDWCAFGLWLNGTLVRSVSVARGSGVVEDSGDRLPFEQACWTDGPGADGPGADGPGADGPGTGVPGVDGSGTGGLPVSPMRLGDLALHAFLGFRCEDGSPDDVDPEIIPMVGYRIGQPG